MKENFNFVLYNCLYNFTGKISWVDYTTQLIGIAKDLKYDDKVVLRLSSNYVGRDVKIAFIGHIISAWCNSKFRFYINSMQKKSEFPARKLKNTMQPNTSQDTNSKPAKDKIISIAY